MLTVLKNPSSPAVSLLVPFYEEWSVDQFLFNLERMELPWEMLEIIFFNDTNNNVLQDKLSDWLIKILPIINGAKLYMSNRPPLKSYGTRSWQERTLLMRTESAPLLSDTEFTILLEDFIVAPRDSYERLMHYMTGYPEIMIASAAIARGGILAYEITPLDNPLAIQSQPYHGTGAEFVDAVGFGFMIARTDAYRKTLWRIEDAPLSVPINFALDLRRRGWKVLLDWDVACQSLSRSHSSYPSELSATYKWVRGEQGIWSFIEPDTI